MMEKIFYIIKICLDFLWEIIFISRPRIWIYIIGSFALGAQIGSGDMASIFSKDLLHLTLWLIFPANLFLYSLNDACDYSTDLQNPKKQGFEYLAKFSDKNKLFLIACLALAPLFWVLPALPLMSIQLIFLWLFLVITYNLPPLRLKGRPILDILFAFNFPLWGIIGYFLTTGRIPGFSMLLVIALFSAVIHIYTSIADMKYDRRAGLMTTSVFLGTEKNNLFVCIALFVLLASILIYVNLYSVALLSIAYLVFFWLHSNEILRKKYGSLVDWYRFLIYLNYLAGAILSIIIDSKIY